MIIIYMYMAISSLSYGEDGSKMALLHLFDEEDELSFINLVPLFSLSSASGRPGRIIDNYCY
ncbi:unnamed protein product [Amoebophrya sp. A25]|nr:unnamed protein product [Amoebophrya sp. A25]|eukprot:GSA25T00010186001.1